METNGQQEHGSIHGSLLRLRDGRSVAIYLRDGVVSVAEFHGGRAGLLSVAEWHSFHARKVAHAQRRGEVETLSPIPGDVVERIEALHRRAGEWKDRPFKRKARMAEVLAGLRRAWPDPAAIGSRLIGAAAFRVD